MTKKEIEKEIKREGRRIVFLKDKIEELKEEIKHTKSTQDFWRKLLVEAKD